MASPATTLERADYTVGLICALPLELAALEAMLDDEHPTLPAQEHDDNQYSLGRIGPHNVVIACLPYGMTGNNSAASVAKDLMRSFRSTRFGLLVGIGGGVPTAVDDMRLGDVAVSRPTDHHGGVVQYDFGKTVETGRFERYGTLNKPPAFLLSALSRLEARHMKEDPQLLQYISAVVTGSSKRARTFRCPAEEFDRLFEATYDHEQGKRTCDDCDILKLKKRRHREGPSPYVHYGNIASGDRVMKHAGTRDDIAKRENVICFEMEAAGLMDRFPCLVIRGICDYADSHKNDMWQHYAALVAAAFAKELLLSIPPEAVHKALPAVEAGNVHWMVPRSSSAIFTGRTDFLRRLESSLLSPLDGPEKVQRRFVITGIGGAGKSEVCLKFAEQHRERFWGVFWIDASSDESAERGFIKIAETCEIQERTAAAVRSWLAQTKRSWLLILDNADNPKFNYATYFPSGTEGCILLTSRERDCSVHKTVGYEEFDNLQEDDAVRLLLRASGLEQSSWDAKKNTARSVVSILNGHALAVVQAGAFIRRGLCTLEEYPRLFQSQRQRLMTFRPEQARSIYGDVYATFEVSGKVLENSSDLDAKAALDLLGVLAFMHFQGVTESIFARAWEYCQVLVTELDEEPADLDQWNVKHLSKSHVDQARRPEFMSRDPSVKFDTLKFRRARSLLASFSLISIEKEGHIIYMHPLVHAWAKDRMSETSYWSFWSSTGSILALATREKEYYPQFFTQLQTHIEACIDVPLADYFLAHPAAEALQMPYRLGWTLYKLRSERKAQVVARVIYDAAIAILTPESKSMQLIERFLAWCLMSTGRLEEATSLLEKLFEMQRTTLAHDHPNLLTTQLSLASAYLVANKYAEALPLLERVFSIRKETLRESDPSRLTSEHELARAYMGTRQYEKAIALLERVVSIRKETLGESHLDCLASEHGLAYVHMETGQYEKAVVLLERVVSIQKETLEESHPDRLASEHELAYAYMGTRQLEKAVEILERVVSIQKETLEESHPNRLASEHELACAYANHGQFEKAIELLEHVVKIQGCTLQATDRFRLRSRRSLAAMYRDVGRYEEAEKLLEEVVTIREITVPADDGDRLQSESLLANIRLAMSSAQPVEQTDAITTPMTQPKRKTSGFRRRIYSTIRARIRSFSSGVPFRARRFVSDQEPLDRVAEVEETQSSEKVVGQHDRHISPQ